MWGGGGVYVVVVEKIWMRGHSMRVDKGWKKIMNLDPIYSLGKTGVLISEVDVSGEQAKWLKFWKTYDSP